MVTYMILQLFTFIMGLFLEGVDIDSFHITFMEIFAGDMILIGLCWCINKLFGADGIFRGDD